MKKIPEAVTKALESIRRELGSNISISRLNGHYYVYRRTTAWDKNRKKVRSIAEYLGRITDDGTFIRKGAQYGAAAERPVQAAGPERLSETDKKILTALSMNSRASLAFIGGLAGLKPNSTHYRIGQLEERYGIRYIIEPNLVKLGYLEYLALVKFVGKRPDVARLKEAFAKMRNVQLVLLTSGRYDMILHFVGRSGENASGLFYRFLLDKTIAEYDMEWTISPFFATYCFVPLRGEFYELLKESVWKRSKETPRIQQGQITGREYAVLREMNADANMDFTDIDKRHGLDRGTSQYTYHRLKENGIIVRPTITMQHTGIKYNAVLIANMINGKLLIDSRENLLNEIIGQSPNPTNRFALVGDTGAPALFIFPVYRDGDLQRVETSLLERVKGFELITLIVTEVLLGTLCYRLFDNMHSRQYSRIIEDYKRNLPQNKVDYDAGRQEQKKENVESVELEESETD
ncbi:MAG: hypothetical protein KGH60_04300 [Candidatus Micrarchaeota archaeon]|nr:hypothetical protein [Candidatus Micrarchaeota archaeon]